MEALFTFENAIALATLTLLEIVLGIDNIVFIAILSQRLPADRQVQARRLGLLAAMGMRIALLLLVSWVMGLTETLFRIAGHGVSGHDVILLGGGLFLVAKATWEIHDELEGQRRLKRPVAMATLGGVVFQIMALDIVFSLDSVITAVGMAKEVVVMIAAIVASVGIMLVFAEFVSSFIEAHPTMKMLALSFLILIGVMLIVEGVGRHVDKGYIYFAMAFSISVESINTVLRKRQRLALERAGMSERTEGRQE